MRHFLSIVVLIPLILFFGHSCSRAVQTDISVPDKDLLRVWALADIQPKNSSDRESFTRAVNDVNKNVPDVNFSIVAGDIVNRTEPEAFDWYIEERNKSYIKQWYEIMGNHDLKTDKGKLFKEKIQDEIHYSVNYGNLLFIFMSDEISGKPTEISDDTFLWWKDLVVNNQDKIIVVITHAPIEGSKIPFSTKRDRKVIDSGRFRKVLEKYKVDLWLSGHLHLPHEFTNTLNINSELNNTVFVHISSIRPEFLGLKHSQSRVIDFICGENQAIIHSRDHDSREWNIELTEQINLSKTVVCES